MFPQIRGILSQGGEDFSPLDLPDLEQWLDSADISTLFQDATLSIPVADNLDLVGGWVDKSTGGNDALQSVTNAQPQYIAADGILFDGVDDFMRGTSFVSSTPLTVIIAAEKTTDDGTLWSDQVSSSNNEYMAFRVSGNAINMQARAGGGAETATTAGTTTVPFTTTGLFTTDSSRTVLFNNAGANENTVTVAWPSVNDEFLLGQLRINNPTDLFGGHIKEIIVCTSVLSVDDLAATQTYLANKWGI